MELPLLPAVLNWQTFPERSLPGCLACRIWHEVLRCQRFHTGALMMPRVAALSGNPRGARLRWEAFRKVENCRGTTSEIPKNHVVDSEAGWSTGHSLCCTTSVT